MNSYFDQGYSTGYPQTPPQQSIKLDGVVSNVPGSAGLTGASGAAAGANALSQMLPVKSNAGSRAGDRGAKASKALSGAGSAAGMVAGLATAAGAANAVPIAGQVAAAGLAIAAVLTKIFAGRHQRRAREAKERQFRNQQFKQSAFQGMGQSAAGGGIGLGSQQGPVGATAPVAPPPTPTYSGWNGQQNPAVQPEAPWQ